MTLGKRAPPRIISNWIYQELFLAQAIDKATDLKHSRSDLPQEGGEVTMTLTEVEYVSDAKEHIKSMDNLYTITCSFPEVIAFNYKQLIPNLEAWDAPVDTFTIKLNFGYIEDPEETRSLEKRANALFSKIVRKFGKITMHRRTYPGIRHYSASTT